MMHSFLSSEALDKMFQPVVAAMTRQRMVPVIRAKSPDDAVWGADVLVEAGFGIVEVADTTPHSERVIADLVARHPDLVVGAGTIRDKVSAQRVHQAGASFIVSPFIEENILDYGQQEWVMVIPGAMSPTEVHHVHALGVPVIKIFPAAEAGGPAYIRALLSVMPELKLLPTGGVNNRNFWQYLEMGALAVGLGQNLVPEEVMEKRDQQNLYRRARQFLSELSAKGETA